MGGFIAVSVPISGTASSPSIPLADSPTSGLFETSKSGIGVSLAGQQFLLLEQLKFLLGYTSVNTLSLSQVAGSPFAGATAPTDCAVTPDSQFVYFSDSFTITGFLLNRISGALTVLPGSPFAGLGGSPKRINVSPDGAWVIAASDNFVAVFSVNRLTGFLTPQASSPFTVGAVAYDAVFSPDQKYVIVSSVNTDKIAVFAFNSTSGFLTPVAGSPFGTGGILSPYGVCFSPNSKYVFVACSGTPSGVAAFSMNTNTGFLTPVTGSPFSTGNAGTKDVAVSPDGAYLFAVNTGANTYSSFSVAAGTGALTQLSGSPFATGSGAYSIDFSPNGLNVVITAANVDQVSAYSYSAGVLTSVAGSPFAFTGLRYQLAYTPDGMHLIAPNVLTNGAIVLKTAATQNYDLLEAYFDPTQGLAGYLNINGGLQIQGGAVASGTANDARYAKLAGLSTQAFAASTLALSGKLTAYNGIATAGEGAPAIYAAGRAIAQAAAVASVASYTLPASDGTYEVSANVLVTTATLHSFNVTVAYTDEGNTARVATLNFSTIAGVISNAAITNAAGAVPYEGVPLHIRCKASTTITIATTGTFTTVAYNVEGIIKQTS